MFAMAVGHSDEVDPAEAIAAAIEQCRATLDGRPPQAGILFASFDSYDPGIVAAVRSAFPGVHIMGCTSSAELSSIGGFQEDSMVLALFASDAIDITAGLGTDIALDVDAACRAAIAQARAGTQHDHGSASRSWRVSASTRSWCWTAWRVRCPLMSSSWVARPHATASPS